MVTEFTESNIQEMKNRLNDAQKSRRMDLQTEVLFDTINKHADEASHEILCEKTFGNVRPYYPNAVMTVESEEDDIATTDKRNSYDSRITWKTIVTWIFVGVVVIAFLYLAGIISTYGWL